MTDQEREVNLRKFAKHCDMCSTPIRKFLTGSEIPCRDCDGQLCEKCCDKNKKDFQEDLKNPPPGYREDIYKGERQ
jgi:hypothetical protein